MKILSIRFQNLNSLKGTFEIRFDKSPFLESGLFAITGPTGAGKTTILDAITVALYGRVHRHDRDAFEIMTRHTTECYAEVEFEVKEKSYRAQWALRRSRGKVDGKLQDVKMTLSHAVSGEIIESKLTETKARIIELTGLDYNQFLRSVMLSQGDFTRFLKASEGERSELLEKITDTGIYSDISVWAFEKAKTEKRELDLLRSRLNEVELLSEEELTAYQTRRQELHEQDKTYRQTKQENENKINWLRGITKLTQKKQEVQVQLQAQLALQEEQQPALQKLKQHLQAVVFKPALTEIKTNQKYAADISKTLVTIAEELPELEKQTTLATEKLQIAGSEVAEATKNWEEAQPVIEKVIQLDATIQNTRTYYEQILTTTTVLAQETENQTQEVQQKKEALQNINAQYIQVQTWLETHENEACLEKELSIFERYISDLKDIERRQHKLKEEKTALESEQNSNQQHVTKLIQEKEILAAKLSEADADKSRLEENWKNGLSGKTLVELENELAVLPSLISLCEQQVQLAKQYQQQTSRTQLLKEQVTKYTLDLKEAEEYLSQFNSQKSEAESHLKDLQSLVELQMRIQKYEADREILTTGEPCPLCGATHHPFTQNHPANKVSEAEEKRNAYQEYILSFTAKVNQQASLVTALQTKITNETNNLKLAEEEGILLAQRFSENNTRLPKPLEIEKPEVITAILNRKNLDLNGLREQLAQVRKLENELKLFEASIAQQREDLVKTKAQAEQVSDKINHLKQLLHRVEYELVDLQEQETNISEEALSFLLQFNLTFDYKNSEALVTDLTKRAQDFKINTQQFREVQLQRAQTQNDLEKATEIIQNKRNTLEENQKQLQLQLSALKKQEEERQQLFGLKHPTTERNRLQETLRGKTVLLENSRIVLQNYQERLRSYQNQQTERSRELARLQEQTNALIQQLEIKIKDRGISSLENLAALFLTEEEAQRIGNLQSQIENNVASYQRLLKNTEEELMQEQARELTSENETDLLQTSARLEGEINQLNREIGRLEQLIQRDTELKLQHQALAQKIEVQQKEFLRWDKLATIIGSADGKKFSKFAQGLTLARLVMLANQHLLKINKRYRILKNPQQDLDLQIVDTYQADAVRPVSTLSGGESFLVSLALALGLSDLAGRQAQIGSLFIDEGFGTLDAETLDMAITSLENLQASGKMIGIISHVEALKERISTQIQVVKMAGGMSKLKVVGHATDAYD